MPAPTSQISRRRVVAGAAWTVPAVAVAAAAPAYAISACRTTTKNTVAFTPTGTMMQTAATSNTGTGSDGTVVKATVAKSGTFNTAINTNMSSDGTYIMLAQNPGPGQYQELTFTFSQPVYNLSFTVADVDYLNNPQMGIYKDGVVVQQVNGSTPVYTTTAKGSNVTGSGTAASPFSPVSTTVQYTYADAAGQVTVKVDPTTGVTTFSIRYYDLANRTDTLSQQIYIGNITYTPTNCILA